MKKSKFTLGLVVLGLLALIPVNSSSQDNRSESVTLTKENTMVLNSEVNGESVSELIAKAKELDNNLNSRLKNPLNGGKNKPLYLFLNTPGGSIQAGLELIEALHGLGRPVNTITLFSASMGFQIAQNLDDRLILQSGVLMSHHAAGQFEGYFGGSQPSQMDSRYQLWLDRIRELDEQTVKRSGGKQTYESYTKQYDHEMWLTGSKSIAQGYADRIVTVKCDASLSGVMTRHVNFMGFDIMYDLDNCPINTSPMNIRLGGQPGATATPGGTVANPDPATTAKLEEVKRKFLEQFEKSSKAVIPMYW